MRYAANSRPFDSEKGRFNDRMRGCHCRGNKCREDLTNAVKGIATTVSPDIVYVDIEMPLPMLKGNVMIVDTPGIGDEDQEDVAQMMMGYLHKAVAIVFVLNVANAGGIQQDRIARVIRHVRRSLITMPCFSPNEAIFVLNKWDTILEEDDRRECLDITKEKLHELWKEVDDNNILKLAAASDKEPYPAMFEDFLKVLQEIIDKNENKRIKIHIDFLEKHFEECNRVVSTKLRFAGQTTMESKNNLCHARKELFELENMLKEARSDLQQTIDNFLWTAADRLYRFIHTDHFKREILFNTEKITRFGIEKELKSRTEEKITTWHREHIVNIFLETFLEIHGERFKKIHEKLHVIKNDMQGIKTPFTAYPRIAAALASSIGSSGTGLLGSLVVSRFLGNPYVAVGVAAVGIVGGLMVAGLVALDIQDDFDTIRAKAYKAITDTLSKEKIQDGIRESYENDIKTVIEAFMDGELQNEIDNLNKNIDTMLRHLCDYSKEEVALRSLRTKISHFIEKLTAAARMKIRSK
ncbi:uncharacterized protein LOC144623867 isoform X3 [Crassostrea virginica]